VGLGGLGRVQGGQADETAPRHTPRTRWLHVTVAIVFALGMALTSFLARTPLAVPLTGRTQMPWRMPRFLTAHPAVLESATDHVEPAATCDVAYPSTVPRAPCV
jgi:hypothetical protein